MQYLRSYQFVFDDQNWPKNLLLATVCIFIPAIGGILVSGYLFEVIMDKHRRGDDAPMPEFNFDNFVKYLMRGLWPFLTSLVISFVLLFVTMILLAIPMVVVVLITGRPPSPLIFMPLWFILILIHSAVTFLVSMPIQLRAGFQQEFAAAFSWPYIKNFIVLTWREMVLSALFLIGTAIVLQFVGLLLCFVGMYPALVLVMFAAMHLEYQIYELYLKRGGEPIAFKYGDDRPADLPDAPDQVDSLPYEAPPDPNNPYNPPSV